MLLVMSDSGPATQPTTAITISTSQLKRGALVLTACVALVVVAAAAETVFKPKHAQSANNPRAQSVASLVSIPVYYPQDLPKGYSYNNDAKVLKTNVLYFSVTGPGKQKFFITQEPIPSNFDFTAFNKKFLNPDTFSCDAGSALVGQAGANMIGSVQTNKNTWVIVNSGSTTPQTELETVIRALEPTK